MTKISELTDEKFARAIPASVRRRLMLWKFVSGDDIAVLRRLAASPTRLIRETLAAGSIVPYDAHAAPKPCDTCRFGLPREAAVT